MAEYEETMPVDELIELLRRMDKRGHMLHGYAAEALTALQARVAELEGAQSDLIAWLDEKRASFGALDGYSYESGEEYGIRCAQIKAEKLARSTLEQSNG